jgi:hypothetical protein
VDIVRDASARMPDSQQINETGKNEELGEPSNGVYCEQLEG